VLLALLCLSCKSDKVESYYNAISKNDKKLHTPKPGEWLYEHKEKGQGFESFSTSNPLVPSSDRNTIYLQPIGEFDSMQLNQIMLVREYLEIFYKLNTVILPKYDNDTIPNHARRTRFSEQLNATYIIDSLLYKSMPSNGVALMAITQLDLYPKEEWNFVFGYASYKNRVGVSSIYRLQDELLTSSNFSLCLSRMLKICTHEIGHMFGLHHCINAACIMNGTNGLYETDNNPLRPCSLCQRKLHSTLHLHDATRLQALKNFYEKNHLHKELAMVSMDMEKLE
jgi:archaemetzincin